MAAKQLPRVIEPQQLQSLLHDKRVLIVDLSDETIHRAYHIPGAVRLDYQPLTQEITAAESLAPDSPLSQALNRIGLTSKHHVIAYDESDSAKACRLLWTLDLLGHNNCSLLNGGLQAWLDERHPVESQINTVTSSATAFSGIKELPIVDQLFLLQHLNDKRITLIDARTPGEYCGSDLRSQRGGHIPGAINLDHRLLLDPEHSYRLRPEKELRALLKEIGVKNRGEIIVYCQSHRRAALLWFVLKLLGHEQLKSYPGGWAEWGNNLDTPIE